MGSDIYVMELLDADTACERVAFSGVHPLVDLFRMTMLKSVYL